MVMNPMLNSLNRAAGGAQNPLQMIAQARKSGMTPMQFLQKNIPNNPQAQQAMRMLNGDQNQLRAAAENIARQRGIDLNAFVQQASSMF